MDSIVVNFVRARAHTHSYIHKQILNDLVKFFAALLTLIPSEKKFFQLSLLFLEPTLQQETDIYINLHQFAQFA